MSSWLSLIRLRCSALFKRKRRESSLDREIQIHLDHLTEQNRQDGMSETDARLAALKEFGNIGTYKEECRDSWGTRTVQEISQDLRFALRQVKKAPGFIAVVTLTLALGIGAVTTIFTFAYGLLIKPLPYPRSEELVMVFESEFAKSKFGYVAPATYLHWRDNATDYESLALHGTFSANFIGSDVSFRAYALTATANYFSMLGVQPALGRFFRSDENTAGKSQVMILSHRIWQNQFAGNPDVIGQSVLLGKTSFTIIGVTPSSFQLNPNIDLYTPIAFTGKSASDYERQYGLIGRVKPGVSAVQAVAQLETLSGQLAVTYPAAYKGFGATVVSLKEIETEDGGPILSLLLGAVGCLLLVTCTNIANLMLARSGARQAEIAVRSALGASRSRIFRQLLGENLLLAGLGGALGICVGYMGVKIVRSFLPAYIHHPDQIKVDGGVIAFTSILTVFTGVAFGLVPALRASRVDLNTALKDGGRQGGSASKGTHRLRSSLVVTQVALALILLSSAGLFVRSIRKVRQSEVGYETKTTYLSPILFSEQEYPTAQSRLNLVDRLVEALSQVHGIKAATFTNHTGPGSASPRANYSVVGSADGDPERRAPVIHYGVSRDYFETLHIPLIKGRLFNDRDILGSPRVALINAEMARTVFAGSDPIGRMIILHDGESDISREVVGVVGNTQLGLKSGSIQPQLYEPYEQVPGLSTNLILRSDGTPLDLKALNATIQAVDPDVPILTPFNIAEAMDASLRLFRIIVSLFGLFSFIALFLASLGIYGVMTYSVSQRTGEIGIRMALGAQRSDILKLVFSHSGKLLLIGMILGLAGALGLAQLLRYQLFNTSPYDPLTFVMITLIFTLVAFLACLFPARHATKIDPMLALRAE